MAFEDFSQLKRLRFYERSYANMSACSLTCPQTEDCVHSVTIAKRSRASSKALSVGYES